MCNQYRILQDIGAVVRQCSQYVACWIQRQPNVKEESLTDWFLFSTHEKCFRVYYKAFSRNEESNQTGADWEWWIVFNDIAIKLRIQAKKISDSKDNYASIAYAPKNQHILQIDRLIIDSNIKNSNSIPMYVFYANNGIGTACKKNISNEGVYICGAKTIYNSFLLHGKKKISKDDILKKSIPISCLFLCPLVISTSDFTIKEILKNKTISSIYNLIGNYFVDDFNDIFLDKNEIKGYYVRIPEYIKSLINNEKINYDWEHEFQHDIMDINSLLIFDLRLQR